MITLITCLNNRPHVSRILMNTISRLRTWSYVDFRAVAAVSSREDAELCAEFGVETIMVENVTAGHKWNAVLRRGIEYGDPVLIMGDDDSISSVAIQLLLQQVGDGHVGFNSIYFHDTETGEAHSYRYPNKNKLIGCGTMITPAALRAAMEVCNLKVTRGYNDGRLIYEPGKTHVMPTAAGEHLADLGIGKVVGSKSLDLWPQKSNGLDNAREVRLTAAGFPPVAIQSDHTIHMTDFKSANNIHPICRVKLKWRGPKVSEDEALWYMTGPEIDYIRTLRNK